jgi:DnaJ family protein C protein 13
MDKLLGRKTRPEPLKPGDCLARYLCIKASWRGRYRRIFCITSTCVITLNPEVKGLAVTNTYYYAEDTDIDSITVGSDAEEFTISARQDKKSKYKPIKFSCKHRTQLLTVLYQCIEAGYALGKCVIATKILGSPDNFSCFRFTGQAWKAVTLRLTPHGVSCYEQGSQEAEWHADIGHLASPAVIVLAPSSSSPAPGSSIFAIMERSGQQPMVFSCSNRDQLLGTMQNLPKKKLGHSITMDGTAQCTPEQLAAATAQVGPAAAARRRG